MFVFHVDFGFCFEKKQSENMIWYALLYKSVINGKYDPNAMAISLESPNLWMNVNFYCAEKVARKTVISSVQFRKFTVIFNQLDSVKNETT
jgi:hypothetical protein